MSAPLLLATAVRIAHSVGMGLPGHIVGIGCSGGCDEVFLTPTDLVQTLITHAEVVADLMKDCLADLLPQPGGGELHRHVWLPIDGDLVGHCSEVMVAAVGQHDTLV